MANVVITPANVVPPTTNTTTHVQSPAIAGEAVSAGETVCQLAADNKYYRADSNDADKKTVVGIAGNTASGAGQRLDIITASPALEVGAHGAAVGTPLFQSATPGKMCPLADLASGSYPTLVAYAATSTTLQVAIAASTNPIP